MMQARVRCPPILALLVALLVPGVARPQWSDAEPTREAEQTSEAEQTGEAEQTIDLKELRKERRARAAKFPVGSRVSRYLTAAAEASDEGNPQEGLAILNKLNMRRLNPFERALIHRLKAYVSYASGDHAGMIESFRDVLAEEVMSLDADNKIRFNIVQLHASLQQWQEAIDALEVWFRYVEDPHPLSYYLMGIAYYQLGNMDSAIQHTETAIDMNPEPPEGWLQLLTALYIQKEDYASATPLLEELVARFSKKPYWVQLSLIYGARDNYRHSLAVQQIAYLQGMLSEDKELRRLARSYLYRDLPYPAARVLEKGLEEETIEADTKAYELLANSWIAAREYDRSLPPLQTAADRSENGNLFVRLGQVYLQREQWDEATVWLQRGIERGDLDKPGNAHLLLGIAYYNDQRVARARSSFARARRHDSTRVQAERWITHIENEQETG